MKNAARVSIIQLILVGTLQVSQASAETIGLAAGVRLCFDVLNGCTDGLQVIASDPTLPFSYGDSFSTTSIDVVFSGSAQAGFGVYGAAVEASFEAVGAPRTDVQFQTRSLDRLTISDPLYDGQAGLLQVDIDLDGTIVATPGGLFRGRVDAQHCVAPAGSLSVLGPASDDAVCDLLQSQTPPETWTTALLPFVFGTPFDFRTTFLVDAFFNGSTGSTGTGAVSVDYLHTMTLVGLHVFTLDGQQLLDPLFVSESGTRYSAKGVVPEPTLLLLFGVGSLGLIARRRRRAPQE